MKGKWQKNSKINEINISKTQEIQWNWRRNKENHTKAHNHQTAKS